MLGEGINPFTSIPKGICLLSRIVQTILWLLLCVGPIGAYKIGVGLLAWSSI